MKAMLEGDARDSTAARKELRVHIRTSAGIFFIKKPRKLPGNTAPYLWATSVGSLHNPGTEKVQQTLQSESSEIF
jgi:hypothetical protein